MLMLFRISAPRAPHLPGLPPCHVYQFFDCTVIGNGDAFKTPLIRRTSFSSQESEVAGVPLSELAPPLPHRCLRPAPLCTAAYIIKQALRTHIDGVVFFTAFYAP